MSQNVDPFFGHHHTVVMLAMSCEITEAKFERDFLAWATTQPAHFTLLDLLEQCTDAVTNDRPLPWVKVESEVVREGRF